LSVVRQVEEMKLTSLSGERNDVVAAVVDTRPNPAEGLVDNWRRSVATAATTTSRQYEAAEYGDWSVHGAVPGYHARVEEIYQGWEQSVVRESQNP
jgi:hypothetical protein